MAHVSLPDEKSAMQQFQNGKDEVAFLFAVFEARSIAGSKLFTLLNSEAAEIILYAHE